MSNSKMSSWNHSKLSSWSPVGAIGSIALFFALVFLAACTDYVGQMEGDFEDWKAEQARESSDSAQTSRSDLQSSSSREELSSSSNQFNPDIKYGELLDSRDGHTYKSVKIGSQTWMAENLNYETDDTYCPDGKSENCSTHGRLYDWNTAKTVCPAGWHLPSKDEWNTLLTAVGGASIAGKVLKSASGWPKSGNGTDAFGFSAIPTGDQDDIKGEYGNSNSAYFWSSTEYGSSGAYILSLDAYYASALGEYSADSAILNYSNEIKHFWYSVRCLQGDVSEQTVESSSSLNQFNPDVEYGELTDSRDGQTYKTVEIRGQVWMAQNLNFKTDPSFCLNNDESNCAKYGRLYQWATAVGKSEDECGYGYTCSLPSGNIQGVCPDGWHLPSNAEFETLFDRAGGASTANKVLKSMSGWNGYDGADGNGTDVFGFSALPAGYWDDNGFYGDEGDKAFFWSSTEATSHYSYYMNLNVNYGGLDDNDKNDGYSVRCLKDDESEQTEESSSSSTVAECSLVTAHTITLSNALQSSQSAINFETGLSDNPHITIKFANEAATIIPGDGVTVYEDNSQTAGFEAEPKPGNTSICREDFKKSTVQFSEELTSGLWLDIVDASGNIYPVMVKKVMFESSSKGSVDIVYYN